MFMSTSNFQFSLFSVYLTERLWLSPGSPDCVGNAGRVLHYGLAVVRGCNRPVDFPRQQPEGGVRVLRTRGAAQVSGHSGAAGHWVHDFCSHGLLRFHDICTKGENKITGWILSPVENIQALFL